LLLTAAGVGGTEATGYTPRPNDTFTYRETINVNNGQGSYSGYTDQTLVTGTEMMKSVSGSTVLAHYSNTYSFSNNQGSSYTNSSSGDFTWSAANYQYVNGTDNQVGYSSPVYVWFAMDPSLPASSTFYALNTQMTVQSKNISFLLLGNGTQWVQTISTEGSGQYQRHDSYGTFTASYTWDEYFDPTTGYIVGYHYVEQDNGQYQGQTGSFTYTDDFYVISTSYTLAPASPATTTAVTTGTENAPGPGLDLGLLAIGVLAAFVLILIVAVAVTRRSKKGSLPQHSPQPAAPGPAQWQSNVELGSRPPEQVVIRDVAKVACKYCGTMIPTTADTCPYCGGPRR
jgi:hypothetical protein